MYWATADRPHWSLSRRAAHDGAKFLYPSIHLSTGRRAGWRGRNRVIRRADSFQCAMEAANGLIDAAEATGNPFALSWALLAYGLAVHDADPVRSLAALRRGLVIAQDSGNSFVESTTAYTLGRDEAEHGDPLAAFDYFTVAIGNYHDSGNTYMLRAPLGFLATFFDRLGRYEPAATIAGFVVSSPLAALPVMAEFGTAIAHLRNVLGEATYESLARKGETMTTAEIVTYAYDQIDQTRAELNAVSK
jgi:hypothetical protein